MSKRYYVFIFLACLSFSSVAQDVIDKTYYRHFYVQVNELSSDEYSELQQTFSEIDNFNTVSYCSSTPGLLVQVNASYPARVSQIETEIKAFVTQKIVARRITSIESISDLDKTNFCK